jgi:dihydroorotate dehydrogenase (fumarate)
MNLTTSLMGLTLTNPLIVGSSPLSRELEQLKRLDEAGAGAVVIHSLFEEQIRHEQAELDHYLTVGTESFAEALSYFPKQDAFFRGPDEYLEHLRQAKAALRIPIIASLNGISPGGWIEYARRIEEAGADALELNIYYVAASPELTGAEIEQMYIDDLVAVKRAVKIPVAMKLAPFFSNTANLAKRLSEAGADGLVLFNRFYQPDLDIEELKVVPTLQLSTPGELLLPLRWVALLSGRIKSDLVLTSGVHSARDAVKAMMAGATAVQICSVLLERGIPHLGVMLAELTTWMSGHSYESVADLRGVLSQKSCPEPAAFERANYMKTLQSYRLPR